MKPNSVGVAHLLLQVGNSYGVWVIQPLFPPVRIGLDGYDELPNIFHNSATPTELNCCKSLLPPVLLEVISLRLRCMWVRITITDHGLAVIISLRLRVV